MSIPVRQGEIWRDNYTGGEYQIVKVELDYDDGSIMNIVIKNINSAECFDVGEWELKNYYSKIDSLNHAKSRG